MSLEPRLARVRAAVKFEVKLTVPRRDWPSCCFERFAAGVQSAAEHVHAMLFKARQTRTIRREFRARDLPVGWTAAAVAEAEGLQPYRNRAREETLPVLHDKVLLAVKHVLRLDR